MSSYINLPVLLQKKDISMKAFADFLNVSESTVRNKVAGKTDFTLPEFSKTCKYLFPEYKPEYIFATEQQTA